MTSSSRARFQADLESAAEKDIPNISGIRKRDDGFVFTFHHPRLQLPHHVDIRVVPHDETFLVYTDADVPTSFAKVLENTMEESYGLKVSVMLGNLSSRLRIALEGGSVEGQDTIMTGIDDSDFNADDDGDDDEDEDEDDIDFDYGEDADLFGIHEDRSPRVAKTTAPIPDAILCRIRQDLRAVRKAGFKVGIYGFSEYGDNIISISARVDKLCLSDETRDAWNIGSSEFIVFLIQFSDGRYTTFEDAIENPFSQSNLRFRLRKCSRYKPTPRQAISAFSALVPAKKYASTTPVPEDSDQPEFSLLGIGSSIDMFMEKDFIPMLKLRNKYNMSWANTKKYLSTLEKTTTHFTMNTPPVPPTLAGEPDKEIYKLPPFLAKEEKNSNILLSLPLLAARFALRYFVRCTDYCMICHQQVEGNFEALKPYVCDDSLCLFQYMNLGFGPSVDCEILNQPRVVDLLVSFCYASLAGTPVPRLREFPTGLGLPVPDIRSSRTPVTPIPGARNILQASSAANITFVDPLSITFDWDTSTAILDPAADIKMLREGKWVVVSTPYIGSSSQPKWNLILHYSRIEVISGREITLRVASRHPIPCHLRGKEQDMKDKHISAGHMMLFSQTLDDLDAEQKAFSMTLLLAALPSITDMTEYLTANPNRQLANWEKMIPPSMALLRWIIASNRSYIVPIDECTDDSQANAVSREDERISGVDGWLQFRFAQGSPEKEALFQAALEDVKQPQRTLLAWHGSNFGNWHSIIRQGLDYSVAANGRAYGNGVYFSRDFDVSMNYAGLVGFRQGASWRWPGSELNIDAAVGLIELVNQTEDFRSTNPHFVVQHCHWIQCRYLFVQPTLSYAQAHRPFVKPEGTQKRTQEEFLQDERYITTGPKQSHLFIPKNAIPSTAQGKRQDLDLSFKNDGQGHTGDTGDEDTGDIEFLLSDNDDAKPRHAISSRSSSPRLDFVGKSAPSLTQQEPKTEFSPSTLDFRTLPQLKPPTYATDLAQKTIARELKKLQQIQSSTALHELGWYISFDNISNMFQWIVEFHSFELSLPLGKDMKEAGVNSIVLEVRFGRDFPLSPPFVRIIRPRFLPFNEGGGGHVTSGGAMCMELLTTSGWSPANNLEAVLVQVRLALYSLEPKPARLQSVVSPHQYATRDYGVQEAFEAYARAAQVHGWQIPKDQLEMKSST